MPAVNCGAVVLGSPVGTPDFVRQHGEQLLQQEQLLLDRLLEMPTLQSAWLLLLCCAAPRANYSLRTVPPVLVRPYAESHDRLVLNTLGHLLQLDLDSLDHTALWVRQAPLPSRFGGLGLRCSVRTSAAAF